jgi:hypothetical protein
MSVRSEKTKRLKLRGAYQLLLCFGGCVNLLGNRSILYRRFIGPSQLAGLEVAAEKLSTAHTGVL